MPSLPLARRKLRVLHTSNLFQDDILIEMMKQWKREKDDRLHSLTDFISRRSYVAPVAKCDHPISEIYYGFLCFLPEDRLCSLLLFYQADSLSSEELSPSSSFGGLPTPWFAELVLSNSCVVGNGTLCSNAMHSLNR